MESTSNDKALVTKEEQRPVQPSRELKDFKMFYIIGGTLWGALLLTILIEWLVK